MAKHNRKKAPMVLGIVSNMACDMLSGDGIPIFSMLYFAYTVAV
jgi:hypothetical protein